MHEVALSLHVRRIAERAAPGRKIRTVHLRIGHLRQVVPETMLSCWSLVTEDSAELAESTLQIESVPLRVTCRACGLRSTICDTLVMRCEDCTSTDLRIDTGEEFILTALDLYTPQPEEALHG